MGRIPRPDGAKKQRKAVVCVDAPPRCPRLPYVASMQASKQAPTTADAAGGSSLEASPTQEGRGGGVGVGGDGRRIVAFDPSSLLASCHYFCAIPRGRRRCLVRTSDADGGATATATDDGGGGQGGWGWASVKKVLPTPRVPRLSVELCGLAQRRAPNDRDSSSPFSLHMCPHMTAPQGRSQYPHRLPY